MEDVYNILKEKNLDDYLGSRLTICLMDNHGFEGLDAILFQDVLKFNNWELPADYNEALEQMRAYNRKSVANKLGRKCPICHSTNIRTDGMLCIGDLWLDNPEPFTCLRCGHSW